MKEETRAQRRADHAAKTTPLAEEYERYANARDHHEQIIREQVDAKLRGYEMNFLRHLKEVTDTTPTVIVAERLNVTRQTVYRWLRDIAAREEKLPGIIIGFENVKKVDQ